MVSAGHRHCEQSEAIQSCLARTLDCFVAALLAMTEKAMLLAMTVSDRRRDLTAFVEAVS